MNNADHQSHSRVIALTHSGRVLWTWDKFEAISNGKFGPEGIAVDRQGNVFVTEAAARTVLKLSPAGVLITSIRGGGSGFQDLGHIAIDRLERLYVAEASANRISVFDTHYRLRQTWVKQKGTGVDQWNSPQSIAMLADQSVAIEDWGNARIEIMTAGGKIVRSWGRRGSGAGEFRNSSGIAVDRNGTVYAADEALHRIQIFGDDGSLLKTISNGGDRVVFAIGPSSIGVDLEGDIYAADGVSIVRLSPDGTLQQRWK